MDNGIIGASIIGIVNGVQQQFPKVTGVYAWGLAVVLGLVAGILGLQGLDPKTGLIVGLASSGVYKIAQVVSTVRK